MKAIIKIGVVMVLFGTLCAVSAFGSATNIYITQSGSPTGNCTSNVQTPAFFNNAANWGTGANQIGPGTTVLLCGTFTFAAGATGLTVQGSGSSGKPIIVSFDSGTILQAPYFGGSSYGGVVGGAIVINGANYVTVDGKNVGVIQNTLNGSSGMTCIGGSCSYQQSSVGVFINGPTSGITVQNLTIQDIYLNCGASSNCSDSNGQYTTDIEVEGGHTNLTTQGNALKHARMGIGLNEATTISGWNIANNTIYDHGWGMSIASAGSSMTGINIYGNTIQDFVDWQFPTSAYHTDGIIAYSLSPLGYTMYVYNNKWLGNLGCGSATAFISNGFGEGAAGADEMYVFNNTFDATASVPDPACPNGGGIAGVWTFQNSTTYVYNNTFIGNEPAQGNTAEVILQQGSENAVGRFENNIYLNANGVIGDYATCCADAGGSDYNGYYGIVGSQTFSFNIGSGTGPTYSLSQWQSVLGFDAHAVTGDPKLNSTYVPQSGSALVQKGNNLYSVCNGQPNPGLGALCYDAAGNARPSSTAWDIGAYQDSPSSSQPAPPTGLAAAVQ